MTYKMPTETTRALKEWVRREFPRNADNVATAMKDHLEEQDAEDAEYLLEKGWWRVYDESDAPGPDDEDDLDQEEFDFDEDDEDKD